MHTLKEYEEKKFSNYHKYSNLDKGPLLKKMIHPEQVKQIGRLSLKSDVPTKEIYPYLSTYYRANKMSYICPFAEDSS